MLYAIFISIQKPFTFSQLDIPDVRMWMVHAMIETEQNRKETSDAKAASIYHTPMPALNHR